MTTEEQERIDAVTRYTRGEKPATICQEMKRSKKWLFKWVNRFKSGDEHWYKSHSRAPKKQARETSPSIEQAIVTIRKVLIEGTEQESKYLGVGADAIQYRMEKLGFLEGEIPSASTIKRIVKKHGLRVNKRERYKRVRSKKRYTLLKPTQINEVHQMDFVGPRFIKGYGAISSLHLIDVVSNQVRVRQFDSKSMDNVLNFLLKFWQEKPIPVHLQVDNGMYFVGDYHTPRSFSRFMRLCLYVGTELVFIAPRSPWMNGNIENFNNWFNDKFWLKEEFQNIKDMQLKSDSFETQFNDLNAWKKRDKGLQQIIPKRTLKCSVEINYNDLPLTDGKIHFIRRVHNDGEITILNEVFIIGEEYIGEYVWTTISLNNQRMMVYYRAQDEDVARMIKEIEYQLKEEIKPRRVDLYNN